VLHDVSFAMAAPRIPIVGAADLRAGRYARSRHHDLIARFLDARPR
jgi:hypothetical protein